MNIGIFIAARSNSNRVKNKHSKNINDKYLIQILYERLQQSKYIRSKNQIIVCTTKSESDDYLVSILKEFNINFFRGSEKDLINRFFKANKKFNFDLICRIDGDDIYTCPKLMDILISKIIINPKIDYIEFQDTPLGLAPKVFTKKCLNTVYKTYIPPNKSTGFGYLFSKNANLSRKFIHNPFSFNNNNRYSIDFIEDLLIFKEVYNCYKKKFYKCDSTTLDKYFSKNKKIQKLINIINEKKIIFYQKENFNLNLKYLYNKNIKKIKL